MSTLSSQILHPPAPEWSELVNNAARVPTPTATRFREQLGLPTNAPLITTGHQPIVFHPGILAKFIAAEAAARTLPGATGWHVAWVVADQDTPDLLTLRRPQRDAAGSLMVLHDRLTDRPAFGSVAVASQPPVTPTELPPPFDRVSRAFAACADAPTLAAQAMGAITQLMEGLVTPAPVFFASQLHQTDLFGSLLDAMGDDPDACARTYNLAAAEHPEARLRPLSSKDGDPELPLWHLQDGQPREPVFASQLGGGIGGVGGGGIPREQLAPRAKLLDAIVRLGGADLFIHGTGGRRYSEATDHWFAAWNPIEGSKALAPVVTVSATRTIDTGPPPTSPAQATRAVWAAHHARHTPALLDDPVSQNRKLELLEKIRRAPRNSVERSELFGAITGLLAGVRTNHADRLVQLDMAASDAKQRAAEHHIASDRTWPFAAYPDETLRELAESIRAAFA